MNRTFLCLWLMGSFVVSCEADVELGSKQYLRDGSQEQAAPQIEMPVPPLILDLGVDKFELTVGQSFQQDVSKISVSGGNGSPPSRCDLAGESPTLPPGLILDPTTCSFSGTPLIPSPPTVFTVVISNNIGQVAADQVLITVVTPPAPVIEPKPEPTPPELFTYQLNFADSDAFRCDGSVLCSMSNNIAIGSGEATNTGNTPSQMIGQQDKGQDLVLYYPFEGNGVNQASPGQYDAIPMGDAHANAVGKVGKAAQFDGKGDYYNTTYSQNIRYNANQRDSVTIMAWFKYTGNGNEEQHIFAARSGDDYYLEFQVFNNSRFRGYLQVANDSLVMGTPVRTYLPEDQLMDPNPIVANRWYHLAMTIHGVENYWVGTMYRDGVQVKRYTYNQQLINKYGPWRDLLLAGAPFYIGARNESNNSIDQRWQVNGLIDELAFWKTNLDEADIVAIYDRQKEAPDPVYTSGYFENLTPVPFTSLVSAQYQGSGQCASLLVSPDAGASYYYKQGNKWLISDSSDDAMPLQNETTDLTGLEASAGALVLKIFLDGTAGVCKASNLIISGYRNVTQKSQEL